MNGRVENDNKIEVRILNILKECPDYMSEWNDYMKANEITASSRVDFISKIRKFLSEININVKDVRPEDITRQNIIKYFISIQQTVKGDSIVLTSSSYQQTIWSCLNNFLQFMVDSNYIKNNYIKNIKRPKNKDIDRINSNRKLLTKDDFNSILKTVESGCGSEKARKYQKSMKDRDMSIFLIFMSTGIRKTALEEINIEDIDFNNKTLTVLDKGNKYHQYKLNELTIKYLLSWLKYRKEIISEDTDALFLSSRGKRISGNAIYKLIDKYASMSLGYHISPHKLRSGFCSIMYNETEDIEFVRRAVGHSNISTTQRYIVTNNNEREKSSDIMNNILSV